MKPSVDFPVTKISINTHEHSQNDVVNWTLSSLDVVIRVEKKLFYLTYDNLRNLHVSVLRQPVLNGVYELYTKEGGGQLYRFGRQTVHIIGHR